MILVLQLLFIWNIMQVIQTPNIMDNVPWLQQEICVFSQAEESPHTVKQFTGVEKEDYKLHFWTWPRSTHPGSWGRPKKTVVQHRRIMIKNVICKSSLSITKLIFFYASKTLQVAHISNSVNLKIIQKSKSLFNHQDISDWLTVYSSWRLCL